MKNGRLAEDINKKKKEKYDERDSFKVCVGFKTETVLLVVLAGLHDFLIADSR